MSYYTWTTYGFGFCVDDIARDVSLTLEKVLNVAKMEPSVYKIVMDHLNEICKSEDITLDELDVDNLDELEGDYCERGLTFILYNVINEIDIVYADNYYGEQYILYAPDYPWRIKENERNLSEEDVKQIFKKYISMLTDEPIKIDYYSVENGG